MDITSEGLLRSSQQGEAIHTAESGNWISLFKKLVGDWNENGVIVLGSSF